MKRKINMEQDSPYWVYLRPLLILSYYLGLYCRPPKKNKAYCYILRVYAILIFLLLLFTIYRCCEPFFSGGMKWDTLTIFKLVFVDYFLFGVLSQLFMIFSGTTIIKLLQVLQEDYDKMTVEEIAMLKKTCKLTALSTVFKIATSYTTILLCILDIVAIAYVPTLLPEAPKFLVMIPAFYCQVALSIPMGLFPTMCAIVRINLNSINSEMKHCSAEAIQELQQRYQRVVGAARILDGYFSNYMIAFYGFTLPLICCILFTLIRGDGFDVPSKVILIIWIVVTTADVVVISFPAIQLYEEFQGQKTLDALFTQYNNQKEPYTNLVRLHQIQIFIEQVAHSSISISGGGFFSITRSLLLTIASVIVTYFLIVLQFATDQNCPTAYVLNTTTFQNAT